ncbi:MAG: hypothetical protein JSU92_04870 [Deltaproteobacteria bacterium]|nr:MAG: hypothetical protein JSU92_04870 [Deltaproteobacteria bacterium]
MEISTREIFEALVGITFTVLMWWVTFSIFRRYRDTKYLPALLVASGFFALGFIFAPILTMGRAIMQEWPEIAGLVGPGAATWYRISSIIGGNAFVIGLLLFAIFTRQVFRPGSAASLFYVIFVGIFLMGSSDLVFMFEDKPIMITWAARLEIRIVYVVGNTLAFGWLAYESLSRWIVYRKRLEEEKELDPLVVNRFLLWGLAGISYVIAAFATLPFVPYEAIQPFFPTLVLNICILAFAILSYLSWSPPEWFKQVIRKGEPAQAGGS